MTAKDMETRESWDLTRDDIEEAKAHIWAEMQTDGLESVASTLAAEAGDARQVLDWIYREKPPKCSVPRYAFRYLYAQAYEKAAEEVFADINQHLKNTGFYEDRK